MSVVPPFLVSDGAGLGLDLGINFPLGVPWSNSPPTGDQRMVSVDPSFYKFFKGSGKNFSATLTVGFNETGEANMTSPPMGVSVPNITWTGSFTNTLTFSGTYKYASPLCLPVVPGTFQGLSTDPQPILGNISEDDGPIPPATVGSSTTVFNAAWYNPPILPVPPDSAGAYLFYLPDPLPDNIMFYLAKCANFGASGYSLLEIAGFFLSFQFAGCLASDSTMGPAYPSVLTFGNAAMASNTLQAWAAGFDIPFAPPVSDNFSDVSGVTILGVGGEQGFGAYGGYPNSTYPPPNILIGGDTTFTNSTVSQPDYYKNKITLTISMTCDWS
jgi:hypothetical protein